MSIYIYSRWDGTQDIFPVSGEDLMEEMSEQLMSGNDVSAALRSITQKGLRNRAGERLPGVQDLLQRLRSQRQQATDKYNLGSVLEQLKERLQDIADTELKGIEKRLQEARNRLEQEGVAPPQDQLLNMLKEVTERKQRTLQDLSREPAQAIQQLRDYEFMDPQAREKFDQLLQELQEQVLKSHFQDIAQRLQSMSPEDVDNLKGMTRELNRMLEEHLQGGQPDFQGFMEKFGQFFGDDKPKNLEELAERMQRQMALLESLLKSMPEEMRQKLEELLGSVFKDQELRQEMTRLAENLETTRPMGNLRQQYSFQGDQPISLAEAMELMKELQRVDELERQLRKAQQGSNLSGVDPKLMQEVMGEGSYYELEQLKRLAELLEEAGYIKKVGSRYELTPKGMRKIGNKALAEIFAYIKKDRSGGHNVRLRGGGGDTTGDTKRYEFGDQFSLHLQRTILNAVERRSGIPVNLEAEDFEVYRTELASHSSTVLMIDLSLSMAMRGNFLAAKKVAMALDNLIRTQFPRDTLYIVGFSTYAREVTAEKLPYLTWDEYDPYTNIQHGLALAQKLLARVSGGTKQIILISDGEPTAHLESGQLFLQYPPSPRTFRETLREVKRCTQRGIVVNTFMLDRSSYLVEFVDEMTRINRGRVFYTSPERLGQYILVDYLASRRRVLT